MEEKYDENLEDYKKIKIIGIDQIVVSKEALLNLMTQQVMKMFIDHDYIVSQLLDYGSNRFVTSEQNTVDLMI
jgi:hypothetical protein